MFCFSNNSRSVVDYIIASTPLFSKVDFKVAEPFASMLYI